MAKRRPNPTGAAVYFDRKVQSQTECARVLAAIDNAAGTGATIKEIAVATGLPDAIVSARLGDLRKAGAVEEGLIRRKCRVNGYIKKIWQRALPSPQQKLFRRSA